MNTVTQYYTAKLVPASGCKHGQYGPARTVPAYPWHKRSSMSELPMQIHPADFAFPLPSHLLPPRLPLYAQLQDRDAFRACLRTLSRGKAPGPDGVTNEMLLLLPDAAHDVFHAFFQIMWATACTPPSWKHSLTKLLFKNKGTILSLDYYRRIGLGNTMYKLWTRIITYTFVDFTERNNLLSHTQAGFRPKRSTTDHLELLTLRLEDALLTKTNLYLLLIDFTEAFDTIDHDNLLQILYDLGFPTDATEVIKDLYTGATTAVHTPFGLTNPLSFDRGTIQGDSLSPFLFILYLEPLLRRLQHGGLGYSPGSLSNSRPTDRTQHHVSNSAYADDLNLMTDSLHNISLQTNKVTEYATWGYLKANPTKTLFTSALYATSPSCPYNLTQLQRDVTAIKIQGHQPKLQDPNEPFPYLGVSFTLDLRWIHQFKSLYLAVKDRLGSLKGAPVSTYRKLYTINSSIRPKITHSFAVAPYSTSQLQALDSILVGAYKAAYGLSKSTAQAFVHDETAKGGLGLPSLQVEYHSLQTQRLICSLNDHGLVGRLTRALLTLTQPCIDQLSAKLHPTILRHSLRLRQLMCCSNLNLEILRQNKQHLFIPQCNALVEQMRVVGTAEPPPLLIKDLYYLYQLGITSLGCLLSPFGRELLHPTQISRPLHIRLTPRQKMAVQRVTHMLSLPPDAACTLYGPPLPLSATCVLHPDYYRALVAAHLLPSEGLSVTSLLHLWDVTATPSLTPSNTAQLQRWLPNPLVRPKLRPFPLPPTVPITAAATDTGYDIYLRITCTPNALSHMQHLVQLYHNYLRDAIVTKKVTVLPPHFPSLVPAVPLCPYANDMQYAVQWQPILMQGWLINIHTLLLGYHISTQTLATPNEVAAERTTATECCGPRAHLNPESTLPPAETVILCDACSRSYHLPCLPMVHRKQAKRAMADRSPWYCPSCQVAEYTSPAQIPPLLQHYWVQWCPSIETRDTLERYWCFIPSNIQSLAPTHIFPDHERMESPRYDITVGAPERAKLCISTAPINPHTDIQPTHCFEVYIRDVLLRLNHTTTNHSVACIYTPDGHCTHTLQPERLAILYAAYVRTLRKKPQLFLRLGATTFAEEVYKLLTRYTEDASATTSYGTHLVKHKNNWSTPPSIYNILSSLTSATKERFASPLNFNPVFSQYWSAHERDQLFGAQWDTFRYAWTGSSVNNPENEDDSLNRNMAYAIDSCLHSEQPVLCAHILPAWTDNSSTSYMTWVREFPEYCLHLLQIPSRYFRFVRPTSYEGTNDTYAANPKWDVNIILTGNKAGFRRYYDHADLEVTNYQLPNGPIRAGRRWGQRHPQGANLGSNGVLKLLSKLTQWLPPAHPRSIASQCMSGQPISTCLVLTS